MYNKYTYTYNNSLCNIFRSFGRCNLQRGMYNIKLGRMQGGRHSSDRFQGNSVYMQVNFVQWFTPNLSFSPHLYYLGRFYFIFLYENNHLIRKMNIKQKAMNRWTGLKYNLAETFVALLLFLGRDNQKQMFM